MNKQIFAFLFTSLLFGFSQAGPRTVGNGGDSLEIKFKEVALNIDQWILSGNADQLVLPRDISLEKYKTYMHFYLNNYSIEMTNDRILVNGAEKTCVNFRNEKSGEIRCNFSRFQKTADASTADLYQLVHHEFAGLAGLEESRGVDSDYRISGQLSAYLVFELVERLPIGRTIEHEFKCTVEATVNGVSSKIELQPISKFETYMLEGTFLNLDFTAYIWGNRNGFDLKVATVSKNDDDSDLIFDAGPSFETNMDGSKFGHASFMHFMRAKGNRTIKVPVNVDCKY